MAKPWHIYLTESVKRSICKGFKIITTFTLTKIVIFFFLWSLIPKKFFCGGGVFVRMLTHACMYKVRKLSFCLGLLLIWCLCLSPPCFLRQSLSVKLGLTISFWPASPTPPPPGFACLHHPRSGVTEACHHSQILHACWGSKQFLMFA